MGHVSLAFLKLSWCLVFKSLTRMCLSVDIFEFTLFGVYLALVIHRFRVFAMVKQFSAITSSNTLWIPSFDSFPSRILLTQKQYFCYSPTCPWNCLISSIYISLLFRLGDFYCFIFQFYFYCFIFIDSSVFSTMLLSASLEFLFLFLYFLLLNVPLCSSL